MDKISRSDIDAFASSIIYFISSILILSLISSSASFILHWIATALLLFHIYRHYFIQMPLLAFWRIYLLLFYGIISSSILSSYVKSSTTDFQAYVPTSGRIAIGVIGVLVSVISMALLYILPLPKLKPPTGIHHRIGTHTFTVNKSRVMSVQCWFPICESNGSRSSFFGLFDRKALMWTSGHPDHEVAEAIKLFEALSVLNNIPYLAFAHMVLAQTHSHWSDHIEVSLDGKGRKMPVAIYSHGLYGWRQIHHTACELLASHGFIVFAVDHTPDATVSRPHLEPHNSARFDFHREDDGEYGPEYRGFYMKGVERRVNDIVELLDHLQSQSQFANVLALNNVLLWGHSYGGNTCGTTAAYDSRIGGIAMWDSWMFPMPDEARNLGARVPLLALSSELWGPSKIQSPFREDYIKNCRGKFGGWNLVARGTDHQNFCDVIHLTSRVLLQRPSSIGPIDPNYLGDAMDGLLAAYFLCLAHSSSFAETLSSIAGLDNEERKNIDSIVSDSDIELQELQKRDTMIHVMFDKIHETLKGVDMSDRCHQLLPRSRVEYLQSMLIDPRKHSHCFDPSFFKRVTSPEYYGKVSDTSTSSKNLKVD